MMEYVKEKRYQENDSAHLSRPAKWTNGCNEKTLLYPTLARACLSTRYSSA
jgi:hypothetical protein